MVPKASTEPNDTDGTARASIEAPASTEPVAAAGHADSEPNDADGTARGSVEAPASTEFAAAAGHANSVPTRSLPPLSPSQIHQQVPSLPENSIQTKPATHVVASNTLRTDPIHTDPTTHAVSQDNTMHADPICSDRPPSLQPDLMPTLAANHGRSEPAMEVLHDAEASLATPSPTITMILMLCTALHNFLMALSLILISISPLMARLVNPLMALNLSITTAGIMMLHTTTLEMDMMDMSKVIGTLQAAHISVQEGDISMDIGASIPTSILRTWRMEDELLRLADLNLSQPQLTESLPRAYIE
ncbi:uncharacterized protein EDB91DRAFT_1246035 [Suillus paluster]|uniref:uncharacterized protein n=1 Tax=Suillus paluster TaxID=48578 RepID=UPI001B86C455|nr:uncharacterized protein EDB91DRAFT_1246035 [Suillus paluster]KAG1745896.1 hypothetical protein EDB91DRAFT_1246035 [Suillus paluster]